MSVLKIAMLLIKKSGVKTVRILWAGHMLVGATFLGFAFLLIKGARNIAELMSRGCGLLRKVLGNRHANEVGIVITRERLIMLCAVLALACGSCGKASEVEPIDQSDTQIADKVVALCKEGKVSEAEKILSHAHTNERLSNSPRILAAAGFALKIMAEKTELIGKKDLYLGESEQFCKRALKNDPTNKIALETLRSVEKERTELDKKQQERTKESSTGSENGDFGSSKLYFTPGQGLTKHPEVQ